MTSTQVSRAQLLLALAQQPSEHKPLLQLALEHSSELWLGYQAQAIAPDSKAEQTVTVSLPPADSMSQPRQSAKGLPAPRNPLQMPEAWVAQSLPRQRREADEFGVDALEPLTDAELQPLDEPLAAYQDLVPLPRLLAAMQKRLSVHRPGGLDMKRLLQACAQRQWPRRLPLASRATWPQRLVLWLDCRMGLYPYRHDIFRLAWALKARVPVGQLSIYIGEYGPNGSWEPWMPAAGLEQEPLDGLPRTRGATCLLLSDMGLLESTQGLAGQWLSALQAASRDGAPLLALAPVEAHQIPRPLADAVQVLRWSPSSRFKPEPGALLPDAGEGDAQASAEATVLEQLLACLAAVLRMDPPLLRNLRQASDLPAHVSLEGKLWAHSRVNASSYATHKFVDRCAPASLGGLAQAFNHVLGQACSQHHAHWPLGMRIVDQMRRLAAFPHDSQQLLSQTRQSIVRLAQATQQAESRSALAPRAAAYVLGHVPEAAKPLLDDVLTPLAQVMGKPRSAKVAWSLVQKGADFEVVRQQAKRNGPGIVLAEVLGHAAAGEPLLIQAPGRAVQLSRLPAEGGLLLKDVCSRSELWLGGERCILFTVPRKHGLVDWQQTKHGPMGHVQLPWVARQELTYLRHADEGIQWLPRGPEFSSDPIDFQVGSDQYGVYLRFRLKVVDNTVGTDFPIVCFRYLPSATFLMGSPDGVGVDDEHPQHPVTLSQGLWLAETPCTQALWQAVMGSNPSHFNKGPEALQRPVEDVSWDDVQQFLAQLNKLLPEGCEAVLPTEAQWEYACRAGTLTAYSWGDEPEDSRANFDSRGDKDWDAEVGTTPVDRYPPNPWGLRDMHGNVWEWCSDGDLRTYESTATVDPMGHSGGDDRVVRGGSWIDPPDFAYSAFRDRGHERGRRRDRGFRFALRSSGAQGAELQPGGLK